MTISLSYCRPTFEVPLRNIMFKFARSKWANAYEPVSYHDHNFPSEDQSANDLLERKVPMVRSVRVMDEQIKDRHRGPLFLKLLFVENILLLFILAAYALTKHLTAEPIDDFDGRMWNEIFAVALTKLI